MATRYQKYDLDQFDSLHDHEEEIVAHIKNVLGEKGKIAIITKRGFSLYEWATYIRNTLPEPEDRQRNSFRRTPRHIFIANRNLRFTPQSRFSRNTMRDKDGNIVGFKIKMKEPVHVMRMFNHDLKTKIITRVGVTMHANAEFTDPDAKPELKFRISLLDIEGVHKRCKRTNIIAQLENGVFYRDGERLDVANNEQMAAEVSAKIAEISS